MDYSKCIMVTYIHCEEDFTCEEGLHVGAVGQLDRCVSGVGGQRGVCAVIEQQPHYWQVITGHCIVNGPLERQRHWIWSTFTSLTDNLVLVVFSK